MTIQSELREYGWINMPQSTQKLPKNLSLLLYSLAHFTVDFSCFFILFKNFSMSTSMLTTSIIFLLYNCIAFGIQPIIGYRFDQCPNKHHYLLSITGIALIILAVFFSFLPFWTQVILCGTGNALFHVGGGINSLSFSNGKTARYGFFASFGALGVAAGTYMGLFHFHKNYSVILLLFLSSLSLILFCRKEQTPETIPLPASFSPYQVKNPMILVLSSLLVVLLTSYTGILLVVNYHNTVPLVFCYVGIAIFSGRYLGGVLADHFGARTTGFITLLLAAALLIFGQQSITVWLLGLIFLNCNTSITLGYVVYTMPNNPGFSFGLTKLAMLIGATIPFFLALPHNLVLIAIITMCIFSSLALYLPLNPKPITT